MAPGAIALPLYPSSSTSHLSEGNIDDELRGADLDREVDAFIDNEGDEEDLIVTSEASALLTGPPSKESDGLPISSLDSTGRTQGRRRRGDLANSRTSSKHNAFADGISPRSKKIIITAVSLAALVFLVIPAFFTSPTRHHGGMEDNVILSNGTHQFRRTVLMVSIDGLRADYLDRGITPHLLEISQKGLRAKSMKPIFPTLTFPNHWSMLTGLYAESHGIVANNFWDPVTDSQFHYSDSHIARQPHWWRGEPIWETAWKAGLTTANLMWLGPWTTSSGVQSTYFVPWKNKVPLQEKHDQIMKWIDLPFETRPQLILAYEPHVDQVGHTYGPDHPIVNAALRDVDEFAKSVHSSLQARNLSSIVDIIFVSDHGMTDTSDTRLVYMDDIMGRDHTDQIEHEDGWPSVGLRMSSGANMTDVIHRLETSAPATANPPQLYVYTEENMPERYHFSPKNNERIAPLYIVPRIGWALTTQHEHKVEMKGSYTPRGNHGYDNEEQSMHAMFVADGPFATTLKKRQLEREEAELFVRRNGPSLASALTLRRVRKMLPGPLARFFTAKSLPSSSPPPSDPDRRKEPQVIPTFNNVELYSLVVKLLGMEKYAAPTNGTAGFWDRYLDEGASVEQDLE